MCSLGDASAAIGQKYHDDAAQACPLLGRQMATLATIQVTTSHSSYSQETCMSLFDAHGRSWNICSHDLSCSFRSLPISFSSISKQHCERSLRSHARNGGYKSPFFCAQKLAENNNKSGIFCSQKPGESLPMPGVPQLASVQHLPVHGRPPCVQGLPRQDANPDLLSNMQVSNAISAYEVQGSRAGNNQSVLSLS